MVFQEVLNKKRRKLIPEFDKLLELCYNNQTHPGDLLLMHQNGYYYPEVHNWTHTSEKLSPYVMGPDNEGHSEQTHYDFIGRYINSNLLTQPLSDYLNSVKFDSNTTEELKKLEDDEAYSIQNEMLIYLKIWESDAFIKSLYQLARIAIGESYDWHFKIKESPNDKTATGTRGEILRKQIIDKFKLILPNLFNSFDAAYKAQIRNAIAHSQYIILGRTITLNNYKKGSDYNNLPSISFDKWTEVFHETIILHFLYNKLLAKVLNIYDQIASQNNNFFQIRINREDPIISTEYRQVKYDPIFKYWR
ncbi:hypothetical protein FO440_18100 [Mucilaginibacter corticis]|uniref:Uncharacterized protein n=1 Tax=Mucilaginibacter corticis TaxID=2597670 RepID=A0A556MIB8_9SPHI|nr:hypothetical protein [Mucilaginibacter corticis]TSJ39654.1 hypothetical protein FO440_18100 [Mucilaginibacter corticis]